MSRIGNKPITIPAGVEFSCTDGKVTVKGPKGELTNKFASHINYEIKDGVLTVTREDDSIKNKMNHGTARAIIANMIHGVTEGYSKTLEIKGTGYRAEMRGKDLVLFVGHSHEDVVSPLPGVDISINKLEITVSGIDKQVVGQMAAVIRDVRKPEVYHGKGIRYKGETISLRQPASAKKSSGGK